MSTRLELFCFTLIILAVLLLSNGCSSNTYAVDCYRDNVLVYRNTQNYLIHITDTTQYDECSTYTIK